MKKLRVLLVDDEIMIREGFKKLFDWEAHECVVVGEAADGMEAITKIDEEQPDIVIMDINIPIINGLKVIQLSRVKYPSMAFVIVSGYDDFSYRNALQLRQLIALISVAVGGCVFISITLTIWQTIFPGEFQQYSNVMSNFSTSSPWLTYCYVLLIGPISEELIFRGAILDRLYLAFPFWAANLLQALLFGIYHMNLVQGIYAFVLGAVLGLVRVSTGTIFASIGTHIIFNATSYVLQLVFPSGQKISIVIFAGVYLLATLLFADGLWYTKNRYEQNKKNE